MDQDERKVITKTILLKKYQYYLALLNEQIELQKRYPQYILGIHDYQNKEDQLQITYNCSENAKSLSKVEFRTKEEKIRMFHQLFEIAEFLKQNNILHNNIKKNNLIIDDNKLYLTDFGYIAGQLGVNMFRNELNFIQTLNKDQKKQVIPYLTKELVQILDNNDKEYRKEKLNQRDPQEIMRYDQHVLTCLMVEIFSPLDWEVYELVILKSFSFKQKLMDIKKHNSDFPNYAILIIEQILQSMFVKEDLSISKFPKPLEPILRKIKKQRLKNVHNQQIVQDYLQNKDFEFDLGLLYCFKINELEQTKSELQESNKEFDCQLTKEISRILEIPQKIKDQQFLIDDFIVLPLDDKLFCLVYLDNYLEDFRLSNERDHSKQKNELLYNYTLKLQLIQFYDEINDKPKEQFKVNQAFQKYYRSHLQIHPQTFQQNQILKEYINIHLKVVLTQFDIDEDERINKDTIVVKQRGKNDEKIIYINIVNEGKIKEMIVHEVHDNHIVEKSKHLKVLKFNRHIVFRVIKQFQIRQSQVELIDYSKKIKYKGEYNFNEDSRDIIFEGQGIREILEQDKQFLQIGDVYKVEGTFHNNVLEGDQITTFYYHFDNNKRTFSQGKYKNGQLSGKHEHFLVNQINKSVKTNYHCSSCFCSPLISCYSWCAWCPCFFSYYLQIS
ncbi:unnamed protein product [Paramecium octaurelia]|uniref:Protein kinase domain-containing protein n=1 Tax=Paramecium octaurelia TaxID=43137 RepID=A0A8S1Y6N2_PAROT|nr:unnamed protein product [Paramecium octaurelia]